MKLVGKALAILFLVGILESCAIGNTVNTDDNKESGASTSSGVDYENYSASDYVVKVKNNTSKKLVVFKGEPSTENLMGGVPASATNHGLKKNSTLFTGSSDFVLFFVTEEDYIANKNNLSNLKTKPFARLYAYYNDNAANNIIYNISSNMGGSGKINLNNNTAYNVELRKDSIHGEVIGYTAAQTLHTTFSVEPGDYYIFPVFRKFDKTYNEIVTVYPKKENGSAYVEVIQVTEGEPMELNAGEWSKNVTFTNGYSYLKIANESDTGISLYDGANSMAEVTSSGGRIINSGSSLIYQIPMTRLNSGDSYQYETSVVKASFRYGNSLKNDYKIPEKTFEAGKIYTFTVTGSDYDALTGSFTGDPLDVNAGFEITN